VEKNYLKEEELEAEKILQYLQLLLKKNKNKLMKSKILALSKNEEFKDLLKKKKVSNKYVTIFFGLLTNKNIKKLNISFVVKKKLGNAVKRNKVKRRLRQITNDAVKKISIKFEYSYLVIAKPTMLSKDYTNIKETLFQDLEKIR
jgi:ribonuclease P protein component